MTREEFELLRTHPKRIEADIKFDFSKDARPALIFDKVPILNDLGYDLVMNGRFLAATNTLVFNVVLRHDGAICRVCVEGQIHDDAGRTHKHELRSKEDTRRNLPTAIARPDLNFKRPKDVWDDLCERARIEHTGKFIDPTWT